MTTSTATMTTVKRPGKMTLFVVGVQKPGRYGLLMNRTFYGESERGAALEMLSRLERLIATYPHSFD